ncbi:MAG: methyltransferase family protein [Mucilaginibacter sp.]
MPLYVYLQLIFFISELGLLIFKRAKSGKIKNERDRRSLLILWIVIALSLGAGPWVAAYHIGGLANHRSAEIAGIVIFALGFSIRWIAIYQLGRMFTVNVVISDEHTLKTSGLYKVMRHPSYTGLLLVIVGLGISLNSLASLLVMFIPDFIALNYRITIEERALTEEFGKQYSDYKSRVNRLVPGIY